MTVVSAVLVLAAGAMFAGCNKNRVNPVDPGTPSTSPSKSIRLVLPESEDAVVRELSVFRFENGKLAEIAEPQSVLADGRYSLRLSSDAGELYLLANGKNAGLASQLVPGETSLADFLSRKAYVMDMTNGSIMMTGTIKSGGLARPDHEVRMQRSVARLDVRTSDKGVSVLKVSVAGLASEGRIFPESAASGANSPAADELETYSFVKDYSDNPLTNSSDMLLYLAEQTGGSKPVEVIVSENGGQVKLKTELPGKIDRNAVYTIDVNGKGVRITVNSSGAEWEAGTPGTAGPALAGMVDAASSVLPSGVSLNDGGDVVTVLPEVCEFELALLGGAGTSVSVNGKVDGVDVDVLPQGKGGLAGIARARIRCDRSGSEGVERIYLDFSEDTVNTGRVTLVFGS